MKRFGWFAVLGPLLFGSAANAAPTPMAILVENATEDLKTCGVETVDAMNAVKASLRYNRVQIIEMNYNTPFVYVTFTGGPIEGACVVWVEVRFQTIEMVQFGDSQFAGRAVVCSEGTLLKGNQMRTRVADEIKRYIDTCMSKVDA